MMLAAMAKSPSWALTIEESEKLSKAINGVTALYDVPMMDERGRAWLALSMVGVEVYGSRIATAVIEANKQRKTAPANVTPMRPQAASSASSPGPTSPYVDYIPNNPGAAQA